MTRRMLFALFPFVVAGCNAKDTEILDRVGHKALDRTAVAISPLRDKFDDTVKGFGPGASLKERVGHRLHWDKTLAETSIDVLIIDHDVELKGKLKSAEQKRRAIELAETTTGIEQVIDHLEVE